MLSVLHSCPSMSSSTAFAPLIHLFISYMPLLHLESWTKSSMTFTASKGRESNRLFQGTCPSTCVRCCLSLTLLSCWLCHPLSCRWTAAPQVPSAQRAALRGPSWAGVASASTHKAGKRWRVWERELLSCKGKVLQIQHLRPPCSVTVFYPPLWSIPRQ